MKKPTEGSMREHRHKIYKYTEELLDRKLGRQERQTICIFMNTYLDLADQERGKHIRMQISKIRSLKIS